MKKPRTATTRRSRTTSSHTTKSSLASRIKPVAQVVKPRSWAIYGRAGSGKTTLAGTFPGPILLVDVKDEGTDSVSDVKGLDVFEVLESGDMDELYWFLRDNPKGYKTVVIDTLTQLQQIRVEEVAEVDGIKSGKAPGDWGTMSQQKWGSVASWMKKVITDYRSLDMEVVFLCQDRVFKGDEDAAEEGVLEPEVGPRLTPSVMSHLCSAVHMVGQTYIREYTTKRKVKGKEVEIPQKDYSLRLGPNSYYITKLRKPASVELPDFLDNPTFEDILEIVTGE